MKTTTEGPPSTITTDPASELRSSIHETISEFNGESVRPSVVVAKERQGKSHEDAEKLQALLDALAFTPGGSSVASTPTTSLVKQHFTFETPDNDTEPKSQTTPPTATTSLDEDELEFRSPIRKSPGTNAAASAYVLSLPKVEATPSPTSSSAKKCKKFPTVDTNIPGAGTLRSSMSYRKAPVKLPFVHIAASTDSPLARRRKDGPATHLYQHVKNAWAGTKNSIGFLCPLMNLTEGAISMTAGMATGDANLEHVDHHVVEPIFQGIDQHVVAPVLGVIGGLLGWNSSSN